MTVAFRTLVAGGALAAIAVGSFAAAATLDARNAAVRRPGVVLVDPAVRVPELAQMPQAARERLCRSPVPLRVVEPVQSLRGRESYGSDPASQPFALAVMTGTAQAIGLGDREAMQFEIALYERWAAADALADLVEVGSGSTNTNSVYSLKRTLLPTIVAWALLRVQPSVSATQRAAVDAWLRRLVDNIDVNTGGARSRDSDRSVSNFNNHRYLRDSINMAWGALTGDVARYRRGVERYLAALGQMRSDGSLPLETARGSRALWYQRHALASLVVMAEIAALQGDDLYGAVVDGKSIHTGIRFLLDATRNPALIAGYAAENVSPGPNRNPATQDMQFLERRGQRHYLAWIEPYVRRFPRSELAQQLAGLVGAQGPVLGLRPLIDDYSGGNLTCFFAQSS